MKKSQLQSMSVDELWDLHEEVSRILSARIIQEKKQLEQRLEQLSQSHYGDKIAPSLGARRTGDRGRRYYPKVYPKYQNPQMPSETWSGRGKQPKWLVSALKAGKNIEDFRIAGAESFGNEQIFRGA